MEKEELQHDIEKLLRFKKYVHDRLDRALVPVNPDPDGNALHGCRIEGRLDWLLERFANQARFSCGDKVRVGGASADPVGAVGAVAVYDSREPAYLVIYRNRAGDMVEQWWDESRLTAP